MADDEQFSLCWNNFNTNLSAGFHESLIRGDLVDVTLAAEGQLVKAHRLILSVCSPYFRKMFTQMPANQHAFIFLKDVSHSALKDLIQFMYCGEVNVKQDALPAFISTAEALQIKGLTETGESAPAQQSPAKDSTSHHHLPSSGAATSTASSPRIKPIQRTRIQSYKLDSDDGGSSDHEKVVQIQAGPSPATLVTAGSSSGATTTLVAHTVSAAPQQVQIMTTVPTVSQATKRTVTQRASITPQTTQVMKRAKMSDPLEASEPAQIQTVQIVKQITQTSAQSTATAAATTSSEPEYVEMPIETINPKAEPEYADDPSEVEAIDAEHDQEQALTEQEQHEHDQEADDSANYVEDETYGDMSKYDESYFTEGDDAKAGASGFGSESYTEGGAADQAAQVNKILKLQKRIFYLQKVSGEFELLGKDPVRPRIETLQRDLDTLKSALPTRSPGSPSSANVSLNTTNCHVDGFSFPLMEKSEIERLEEAVRENPYIRDQYVEFLHHKKPRNMTLVQFLPMVFADEALISYNLHGSHASGKSKLSMKGYFIFSSCILEAFDSEGLEMNDLCNQLAIAIKQSRNRMRQRTFRAKKSIQKLSTKAEEGPNNS